MRTVMAIAAMLLASIPASGKYYEAEHYNVTLQLDSRGLLTVTEIADFRFVAGPFEYVFRDLATTETDGIENVEAWMDGRPCENGTGPGQVEIHGTSPVKVKWHFASILSGSHRFTVRYRVAGAIRPRNGYQVLIWRVLPEQKNYHVGSSEIVLEYPPDIRPRGVRLRSGAPDFTIGPGRASAVLVNPPESENVVLGAQFPEASFSGPAPVWQTALLQRARDVHRGRRDGGVAAAILVVLACLWMFRVRAEAKPGVVFAGAGLTVPSPPSSLAPALAGGFVHQPGLRLGTLIDLACRGVLRIEEAERGFLGSRQFQVVKCDTAARLAPHEDVLFAAVFGPDKKAVRVSEFFSQSGNGKFVSAIRRGAEAAGLVEQSRERARNTLLAGSAIGWCAGLLVLAGGIYMGKQPGLWYPGAAAVLIGGAGIAAGVLAMILAGIQPIWSDLGMAAAAQWKAFARYLTEVARERAPLPGSSELGQWLPYAAEFGVLARVLKLQEKRDGYTRPDWFQAIAAADNSNSDVYMACMYNCESSSSSDSGGSGSSGSSGGASGGGASGAG